jgi:hypothetical protein
MVKGLEKEEAVVWGNAIILFFKETLRQSIDIEQSVKEKLVQEKAKAFQEKAVHGNGVANQSLDQNDEEANGMFSSRDFASSVSSKQFC